MADVNNQEEQFESKPVIDENRELVDGEKLPVHAQLKVLRYRTLKKNVALGWWSAVVLLEDHQKKQICYYRWRRKDSEWKRDKKLPIRSHQDWQMLKDAVESFLKDLR
jgi:hypothetical protein